MSESLKFVVCLSATKLLTLAQTHKIKNYSFQIFKYTNLQYSNIRIKFRKKKTVSPCIDVLHKLTIKPATPKAYLYPLYFKLDIPVLYPPIKLGISVDVVDSSDVVRDEGEDLLPSLHVHLHSFAGIPVLERLIW